MREGDWKVLMESQRPDPVVGDIRGGSIGLGVGGPASSAVPTQEELGGWFFANRKYLAIEPGRSLDFAEIAFSAPSRREHLLICAECVDRSRAGRCARKTRFSAATYSFQEELLIDPAGHIRQQAKLRYPRPKSSSRERPI